MLNWSGIANGVVAAVLFLVRFVTRRSLPLRKRCLCYHGATCTAEGLARHGSVQNGPRATEATPAGHLR
jgi:hypothetical protein